MNSNLLVLIDAILGFLIVPIGLLIGLIKSIILHFFQAKAKKNLIIKFLGAGNLVAIHGFFQSHKSDLLTAKSNAFSVGYFDIGDKKYYIDSSNIFLLALSCVVVCFKLLFSYYNTVINLETESHFAKFLVAISSAKKKYGISNINKSYIDFYLYDRLLVSPAMTSKLEVLNQLIEFNPVENEALKFSLEAHRKIFLKQFNFSSNNSILLSPTCSDTDALRRLAIDEWRSIISIIKSKYSPKKIFVVFSSTQDCQFNEFKNLTIIEPLLEIKITGYKQFVEAIRGSDLLITVDSQALHIAQKYKKKTIAIYGPTSPLGVALSKTTYPISKSLVCSPCTHKYLKVPCNSEAFCMKFSEEQLRVQLVKSFQDV